MNTINNEKPGPIPSLTGLRFVAAFSIVLHHLTLSIYRFDSNNLFNDVLKELGSFGMSLFFVLSGFVIHYNYYHKIHTLNIKKIYNFLIARFARLYPLFISFLIFDLSYQIIIFKVNIHNILIPLLRWLTLSQSWWYSLNGSKSITYSYSYANITWSISVEVLFYFSYPLFAIMLNKIKSNKKRLIIIIIGLMLSLFYYGTIINNKDTIMQFAKARFGQNALEVNSPYDFWTWIIFLSPIVRFPEFLLGVLGAHLILGIRNIQIFKRERIISILLLVISILGLLSQLNIFEGIDSFFANHLFYYRYTYSVFIIILYCSRYNDVVINFLSINPILKLGDISYSIYLIHTVILYLFDNKYNQYNFKNLGVFGLKFLLVTFLIILVSSITYKLIEVPFKSIIKRKLSLTSI